VIRAVFFDLGGTLFSYDTLRSLFGEALAGVADAHGLDVDAEEVRRAYQTSVMTVMADYVSRPYYLHRDLFAEAHTSMLERLGVPVEQVSASPIAAGPLPLGLDRVRPREGTREVLGRLRGAGLHLAVVSNIDDDQFDAVWGAIGLADCFDAVTTSEAARSCKPHRGIFEVALAKAGAPAEAVAFVGDSLHHDVAGANAVGMRSVWLTSEEPAADAAHRADHVIRDLRELPGILLG